MSILLTDHPNLSAKQTMKRLRASNLRLHAKKSDGCFICRITDATGNVVSVSSRSTLESAITIAVGNLQKAVSV
ncbi:hypothetical protein [Metabacillus sp. SLBN-84]